MERKQLARSLENLVIFKNLRNEELVEALIRLLDCDDKAEGFAAVCALARALYPVGDNLTDAVLSLTCMDENDYIKALAAGESVSPRVSEWAVRELNVLSQAAAFSSKMISFELGLDSSVPGWDAEKRDFAELYHARVKDAQHKGYGMFAKNTVFTVSENGELLPVKNPDTQSLSQLYGYERERKPILQNTEALLAGLPANNVLLYGDAGTGKSSTVKAIANEYANRGLRLIQVEKSLLHHIPALLDSLASNPLKFIIYIDDLSFTEADRDFTALKTILEGSVAARAKNTAVYATSNRRHLVKETVEERQGSEIHLADTLQESASLSARFGIVVTYVRPDKDEYLQLVKSISQQWQLAFSESELNAEAESYAIRAGGRSPRVAKQYVEYKMAVKREEI